MTNNKNKKSQNKRSTKKHRQRREVGMNGRRGTIVAVVAAGALVLGGSATLGALFVQAGSNTAATVPDAGSSASDPAGSTETGPASDPAPSPGSPSSADAAAGESSAPTNASGTSKEVTGDESGAGSSTEQASTSAAPDPLEVGLGPSAPKSLSIPAIKVNANLAKLAMAKDETIELPSSAAKPGWYSRSPSPGEVGPAIVAGFIRTPKTEGVFANLGKLKKGHKIMVNRADGKVAVFKVDKIKQYPVGKFVASEVYSSPRQPMLRIVTVGGTMKPADKPGNVVVFSHLVGVEKAGKTSAKSASTTGSR